MNAERMIRLVAVLVGAVVLFGLSQRLALPLYLAIPAGIIAYFGVLVALGLWFNITPLRRR